MASSGANPKVNWRGNGAEVARIAQWAFQRISPSAIVSSEELREVFRRFLQRGTETELRQLCLENSSMSASTFINTPPFRVKDAHSTRHSAPTAHTSRDTLSSQLSLNEMDVATEDISSPFEQSPCRTRRATSGSSEELFIQTPTSSSFMPDSGLVFSFDASQSLIKDGETLPSAQENPAQCAACLLTHCQSACLESSYHPYLLGTPAFSIPPHGSARSPPSSGLYQKEILSNARTYFEGHLGDRKYRTEFLVRAVQGIIEAPNLAPPAFRQMWANQLTVFTGSETGDTARFRRLYEGHRIVKQRREEYAWADRLCYVFLEHELEHLLKVGNHQMSQGRGRKTAALYAHADIISSTVDVVRADHKAGKGYVHLLIAGGPGFLLSIGSQVSSIWERKLSRSDIGFILVFVRQHLPETQARIEALNAIAAQAIIDGFIAYGWNFADLTARRSELLDTLLSYINTNQEVPNGEWEQQVGNTYSHRCSTSSISSRLSVLASPAESSLSLATLPRNPTNMWAGQPNMACGPTCFKAGELDAITDLHSTTYPPERKKKTKGCRLGTNWNNFGEPDSRSRASHIFLSNDSGSPLSPTASLARQTLDEMDFEVSGFSLALDHDHMHDQMSQFNSAGLDPGVGASCTCESCSLVLEDILAEFPFPPHGAAVECDPTQSYTPFSALVGEVFFNGY